jgi:cob(I)alamin adenosyltransferase
MDKKQNLTLEERVLALENNFEKVKSIVIALLGQLNDMLSNDGPIQDTLAQIQKQLLSIETDLNSTNNSLGDHNTVTAIQNSLTEIKNMLKV